MCDIFLEKSWGERKIQINLNKDVSYFHFHPKLIEYIVL